MLLTYPQCKAIFRGDCGSDLRRVNDITYQRPRHSNRLFYRIDRGLSPDWLSHIAANQQSPFFVKLDIDSGAKA